MFAWLLGAYPYFGWAASGVIVTAILIAAGAYRGKAGERYSISRHFISELGEVGVSRLAVVFNAGLMIGGFFFLLMMLGVGAGFNSVWGYLAMAAGMVAAVGCIFVGIFPMNNIKPHAAAAMTYFRAGLAAVLLFCIAIILQPADRVVMPYYSLVFSLVAVAAYTAFLVHAGQVEKKVKSQSSLDTSEIKERPAFWWMPFLEWMVFFSTILWFVVICTVR